LIEVPHRGQRNCGDILSPKITWKVAYLKVSVKETLKEGFEQDLSGNISKKIHPQMQFTLFQIEEV